MQEKGPFSHVNSTISITQAEWTPVKYILYSVPSICSILLLIVFITVQCSAANPAVPWSQGGVVALLVASTTSGSGTTSGEHY